MSEGSNLVRVNTRLSKTLNAWLDKRSELTGLPKSTLIMIAVEDYYKNTEVLKSMGDMGSILEKLDEIQKKIDK